MPMTDWPGAKPVTPLPAASTTPANSVPGVKGRASLVWYRPCTFNPSTKPMLAACTLTRTCAGATSGIATSLSGMLSMVSYCSTTTAFMRFLTSAREVYRDLSASCKQQSADPALAVLPERLSQLALQNLAGAGERQWLVRDLDAARTLVAGDQRLAELHEFVRVRLRAGLRHHDGMDLLAPTLVGDTNHGALRHGRMLRQR